MKENYVFKNPPRNNPYAERMKKGYTIIIERGQEGDEQLEEQTVKPAEIRQQKTMLA